MPHYTTNATVPVLHVSVCFHYHAHFVTRHACSHTIFRGHHSLFSASLACLCAHEHALRSTPGIQLTGEPFRAFQVTPTHASHTRSHYCHKRLRTRGDLSIQAKFSIASSQRVILCVYIFFNSFVLYADASFLLY